LRPGVIENLSSTVCPGDEVKLRGVVVVIRVIPAMCGLAVVILGDLLTCD